MKKHQLLWIGKLLNALSPIIPNTIGKIIFHFFSKPLNRIGFTTARKKILDESKKTISNIDGHHIAHYHWPGSGPSVLLLHGWESNSGRWKSLINKLNEKDFNVYAFDAPAHGYSSGTRATPILFAQIADHFVQELNIKHLIGHSFGGYTVIFYGHNYKHTLETITALAPTNSIGDVVSGMQKALGLSKRTVTAFERVFKKSYGDSPDAFDAAEFAKTIDLRGLVIHDKNDLVLPVSGSRKISDSWVDSTFIETSGLGHRLISNDIDSEIVKFIMSK